jgi:fructoselysine 6-kinase
VSRTDRAPRVAVVGDNCIDWILPAGQRFVGGNAVNVGVQLAGLGARVTYFGAVGADAGGALVAAALEARGVDLAGLVVRAERPTSRTTIEVDATGDRRIVSEDFGACDGYAPDAAALALLEGMEHIHIGWLNDGGALRRHLVARHVPVSQDISVNAAAEDLGVDGLAIAFVSAPGTHAAARAAARGLLGQGARGVVVTRGAMGSSVFLEAGEAEAAAVAVAPLDTTGAGDSYVAGFLMARLNGAGGADAAAEGARVAARCCLHSGGFPQEPA